MSSMRTAAFRVFGLGEVIFALAVIVCLRPGNERFVRDVLDRGELDVSIVVSSIVALIVSVLLLRDGALRGWRPSSGTGSTAGVIALLALLLAFDTGSAVESVAQADAFVLTQRQARAYCVLLDTPTFAAPMVGFLAVPSKEYIAFRILRSSPYARTVFLMLVTHAKLPGRLYALAALRRLDRGSYERFIGLYVGSDEEVMTFSGCVASHAKAGHIVRAEHPLEVGDGESGSDAFKRHHGGDSWEIDIEHGGCSSMLFEPMPPQFEEECRSAEQTYDLTPTAFQ
jgi:hypothetical protein